MQREQSLHPIAQNETEQIVQLNTAILPSEEVADQARSLSERLTKEFGVHFTLNKGQYLPHLTVSQAAFPERNAAKVVEIVRNISQNVSPFDITLDGVSLVLNQFVFWNAKRDRALDSFHQQVVDQTNELREGRIIKHVAAMDFSKGSDDDTSSAQDRAKYGALLIGSNYQPHITLTRSIKNQKVEDIRRVLGEVLPISFPVRSIIIGNLGNHGTVNGMRERMRLG